MPKDFIYLASASPRRGQLLEQIGVAFEVRPAEISEATRPGEAPEDYVRRIATAKAEAVWAAVSRGDARPVLAADTAVVLDGRVLGKPDSRAAALAMLEALSGRQHEVLTAVALCSSEGLDVRTVSSEVRFRATTPHERDAYCRTDEPADKAGGYGIQGLGAVFIERLTGSYSAVMGLPLYETADLLARLGLPRWLCADASTQ